MCKPVQEGVVIDVYCPVCGNDYETTTHIFLDCELASEYWAKSPFRMCTKDRKEKDFGAWCHSTIKELDDDQRGLLVTLLWGLWTIRNKWVFEGKKGEAGLNVMLFVDGWRGDLEAMESSRASGTRKAVEHPKWIPPREGLLKVNVDASTGRDGRKGVGVVVRDSSGEVKVMACRSFKANWEVEMVEAYAVLYGLQIGWQEGLRQLELVTDSKQVAEALNGRRNLLNYTSILIHDVLKLGNSFPVISFSYESRRTNSVAHELAQLSLRLGEDRIWHDCWPSRVAELVELDRPCCSVLAPFD